MRVSFVLLLTPFILACGRLSDRNPDHPIPLVYLQIHPTNWERRGASGREQSVPKHLRANKVEFRLPLLGEARGQNADSAGKIEKCECDREHYGNVKDEWAIIGTADETHTKACGRGQRPDGSKVYSGWLYLYLGSLISNSLRDPHDAFS